jgi:hypothetical protein
LFPVICALLCPNTFTDFFDGIPEIEEINLINVTDKEAYVELITNKGKKTKNILKEQNEF